MVYLCGRIKQTPYLTDDHLPSVTQLFLLPLPDQEMSQSQPCGHNPDCPACPKDITRQGYRGWRGPWANSAPVSLQLPYEKACKNKLFCVAELQLSTTSQ